MRPAGDGGEGLRREQRAQRRYAARGEPLAGVRSEGHGAGDAARDEKLLLELGKGDDAVIVGNLGEHVRQHPLHLLAQRLRNADDDQQIELGVGPHGRPCGILHGTRRREGEGEDDQEREQLSHRATRQRKRKESLAK